jgi:hypothetical protein
LGRFDYPANVVDVFYFGAGATIASKKIVTNSDRFGEKRFHIQSTLASAAVQLECER